MMQKRSLELFLLVLTISFFSWQRECLASKVVNPHWTGEHCIECHTTEKGKVLQFEGDIIKVCNRCHQGEFARTDIHPVAVELTDTMKKKIPPKWPLQEGTVTCLTCHDAVIQMTENAPLKVVNPLFIRGVPYESINDFCFTCHTRESYEKTNPHTQLDEAGNIIEERCVFCHQSLPDPQQAQNIADVSFKSARAVLCKSCHGDKWNFHPARSDHLVEMSDAMKDTFHSQVTTSGVDLPLYNNAIFCGTCHNPHQEGVLQRKEAVAGAGERYFLRLDGGKALCITCHYDKQLPAQEKREIRQFEGPASLSLGDIVQHKPSNEKRCKACHAITAEKRGMPEALFLCFREGCHKTDIIDKEFSHKEFVLQDCTFCHNPHSSANEKLLTKDVNLLCSTCHPLIRDKNGETLKKQHNEFFYPFVSALALPSKKECSFCHSPKHKQELFKISTDLCSECHLYLRQTVSQNIHQGFEEKTCSACHDPHSAPYQYHLKEPPETYSRQ
ncbi:MAG: cytochrome c3 family protein [Thermodesulfobacteriota bacterium]